MFSLCHFSAQVRAGLSALRQLAYVFISGLLLCLSIGSVQAQIASLPEGYELHPLGGGLNDRVSDVHAVGDDIYYGGTFTQAFNALDGAHRKLSPLLILGILPAGTVLSGIH